MELNQYLEMFIEESKEHLQACSDNLLELEKNPEDVSIVNEIFRSAHTLKGMSATMGYEDLADLTHKMENVLDAIRNHKISVNAEILDVVFESVDHLEEMIMDIAGGGDGKRDVKETVAKLKAIETGQPITAQAPVHASEEVAATAIEETTEVPHMQYDDYEKTVLQQSSEQDYHAYEITVVLREDCLLKAARVFMVFDILEKNGDVIKSVPSADQLEEEKFDQQFQVAFITKDSVDEIQKKIMKVSEVDKVIVSAISHELFTTSTTEVTQVETTVDVVNESNSSSQSTDNETKQKSNTPSKSQVHAASSKTIRVSIERLDILMNLFEELVIDRGRLQSISTEVNHSELNETVERMSRTMGDLQNIVLTMRMVPVDTVFNRFPKMVRIFISRSS